VTEQVGGICEKLSFASNTSAPGAAVLVRYEDYHHMPVDKVVGAGEPFPRVDWVAVPRALRARRANSSPDKVVGAGSRDNAPSTVGCSNASCPSGDRTDPVHHKQRCPAGMVVSAPFPSWNRSRLAEIYLCHACSYHEIENGNGAPGDWHRLRVGGLARFRRVRVLVAPPADPRGRPVACTHVWTIIESSCLGKCMHSDSIWTSKQPNGKPTNVEARSVLTTCNLKYTQIFEVYK
jgi:hypothetical protein